jgi:hypothetical protein
MRRRLAGALLVIAVGAAVVCLALTGAASARTPDSPLAFSSDSRPYGLSISEWSEQWWRWALSAPTAENPILDLTGEKCGVNQDGHVWYLPSLFGGGMDVTRECTVPHNRALFVPLSSTLNDYPCPDPDFQPAPGQTLEAFLTDGARANEDRVVELSLSVDGTVIDDLFSTRATTPLFHFTADPSLTSSVDPCLTGSDQVAVADGFYVIVKPLPAGSHEVVFHAATARVSTVLTFHLTVL